MKEQVARILGNMTHEIKQCDCKDPVLGLEIKQATLQICQKFPKTVDNPDGYELKPDILFCPKMNECGYKHDCSHAKEHLSSEELCRGFAYKMCLCPKPEEGGLLTDDEIKTIAVGYSALENGTGWTRENLINIERVITKTAFIKDAECQERVGRIFKEFEKYLTEVLGHNPEELRVWQSLKGGVK